MTHTPDPEPSITTDKVLRALRTTGHIDIPDPDGTGDFYRIDVDLFRINGEANDVRFINLDELEIILRDRDNTRPQIICGCGRTFYIPAAGPDTVRAQHAVARWALLDVADAMHSGALDYGPGNASAAVRDWANDKYPETNESPPLLAELEELAASFDDSIDWSDGRNNYGDNEAYAACGRQLRALIANHRKD